jgi:hypothetical protein
LKRARAAKFLRAGPLLATVVAVGCFSSGPTPLEDLSYDPALAQETLTTALDAWKKGRAAELARRQPPIRFVDDDWRAGWQLVWYEFPDPSAVIRPFQGVAVRLVLRDRTGKEVRHEAVYQVSLKPGLAVLRSDS